MGNTPPLPKKGVLYAEIRSKLRPFDLILFKGDALFSKGVVILEHFGNNYSNSGEFTHTGIVVTSEILDRDNIIPGKIYILESTIGGTMGHGIKDIDGKTVLGVQIRDLDLVIPSSDESNNTIVACGKLLQNPLDTMSKNEVKQRFTQFCDKYVGKSYDSNPYSLLSSVFPSLRKYRDYIEKLSGTQEWLFCSEVVALIYKIFGIYPDNVNEKDVLPRDLIRPWQDVDTLPKIIGELIYITTPKHYIENNVESSIIKL